LLRHVAPTSVGLTGAEDFIPQVLLLLEMFSE